MATKRAKPPVLGNRETFCFAIVMGLKPHDAYMMTYPDGKTPSSASVKAKALLEDDWIKQRIDDIRSEVRARTHITVEMLIEELEEARVKALTARVPQASAAVGATMGKARLAGLDKNVMVHMGSDGLPLPPTKIEIVAASSGALNLKYAPSDD